MDTPSSHSVLSRTDGIANSMTDSILLVARILVALVFLMTAWGNSPNPGYLRSLGYPAPEFLSMAAIAVEWIISVSLILGIGTRYGALLGIIYVIVATATAHRYWQYPAAQQGVQYIFLTKNLAIFGGLLLVFVNGAGRYSIDRMLARKG